MKNQDLKSGLFGSIGENMAAFELAKRNWYVYRPYFDTRIDFIAQKFVCKKCFSDWESKHIVICSNKKCKNHTVELNVKNYIKTRKCPTCNYILNKYAESLKCPQCSFDMEVAKNTISGQRNYSYLCKNCECSFTSQTRWCVQCGQAETIEYPICELCKSEIVPKSEKCDKTNCNSNEYALIFRTIQVKSSHEEEKGTIGFNFKIQDLMNDPRHFLVVYSRTFIDYKEKHNFWVMNVNEFRDIYVKNNASNLIYQNARLHPPAETSEAYFNEIEYNKTSLELQKIKKHKNLNKITQLEKKLQKIDVFGKLNKYLQGDF